MNPIDDMFRRLRADGRKAFIPFLPAGDPDLAFTRDALTAVAAAGGSLLEVGFPFSDPIADGPVIQASYTRALNNKLKIADLFATVKETTSATGWATPVVGMASYSLIHKRGLVTFVDEAMRAGFSGMVVPDLPVEEADDFAIVAKDRDFKLILLVTPTTSPKRAEAIVNVCGGFVYVVSVVGITGQNDTAPSDALHAQLSRLRTLTDLPLCVGFGVSTAAHVRQLRATADGVIVGTALVKKMTNADTPDGRATALTELAKLTRELSVALCD